MKCPTCGGSGELVHPRPRRRNNYDGSVYQRKSDGRWVAAMMIKGARRTASSANEGEAWRKLGAMQAELGLKRRLPRAG